MGKRGWILLTIDARLRYNPLEQQAILKHGVAAFVFTGGATHDEKAAAFLAARGRSAGLPAREPPPFIAKIPHSGSVEVWLRGAAKRGKRKK